MTSRIVRIGNALTVEIPEKLAAEASLSPEDQVEWLFDGAGRLTLAKQPAQSVRRPDRMTLEELVERIPEGAEMEKIDWGPPRGKEIW